MIELKDICKQFDDYVIFKDFNYQFHEGQTYALIGESGAGKTTLLNIIGKLETVQSGSVEVDGKDLKQIKEKIYFKTYFKIMV